VREDDATNLLAAVDTVASSTPPSPPSPPSPDTRKPPPDLRITELATDPMVLAASPDHPLASHDQIPLTQLRDELMVARIPAKAGLTTNLTTIPTIPGDNWRSLMPRDFP
jgi:DNA-binding transcriptional LysR family regulator